LLLKEGPCEKNEGKKSAKQIEDFKKLIMEICHSLVGINKIIIHYEQRSHAFEILIGNQIIELINILRGKEKGKEGKEGKEEEKN